MGLPRGYKGVLRWARLGECCGQAWALASAWNCILLGSLNSLWIITGMLSEGKFSHRKGLMLVVCESDQHKPALSLHSHCVDQEFILVPHSQCALVEELKWVDFQCSFSNRIALTPKDCQMCGRTQGIGSFTPKRLGGKNCSMKLAWSSHS